MKKKDDAKIPLPPPLPGIDDVIGNRDCFDPLGSYTGRMSDRDEIPVQDADDL